MKDLNELDLALMTDREVKRWLVAACCSPKHCLLGVELANKPHIRPRLLRGIRESGSFTSDSMVGTTCKMLRIPIRKSKEEGYYIIRGPV